MTNWHILMLRLRAWRLTRRDRGEHPVAECIARGEWLALDALLADLDADPFTRPVRPPMTPGVSRWE